nr:hypothetical protein [Nitrosomonas nitrosa]
MYLPIEAGMKRCHVGKLARFGKQNSLQVTNAEETKNDVDDEILGVNKAVEHPKAGKRTACVLPKE